MRIYRATMANGKKAASTPNRMTSRTGPAVTAGAMPDLMNSGTASLHRGRQKSASLPFSIHNGGAWTAPGVQLFATASST